MSNIATGMALTTNTPNYIGLLFPDTPQQNPTMNMIGGVGGSNNRKTLNKEFATSVIYGTGTPSQPAISETASLTAPAPTTSVKTQNKNVTQIFQETVAVSYEKMNNLGRLSGINSVGGVPGQLDEMNFQIARMLERVARKINYTLINGVFHLATSDTDPDTTGGLIENAGTIVTAPGGVLSKVAIDMFIKAMFDAGAMFTDMYMVVSSDVKVMLDQIYTSIPGFFLPATRTFSGTNISGIMTQFCTLQVYVDRDMPTGTLLVYDLPYVNVVEQDTIIGGVNRGNFFIEDLAKVGASNSKQLFGKIGLNYSNPIMHGVMNGITSAS